MRTHTLTITTPEGIAFSLELAGPAVRFLAWAVDAAVIVAAFSLLEVLFRIIGVLNFDLAAALSVLVYFILSIGYRIAAEWLWNGQTLGKRLLRLQVLDAQGLNLQFSQIVVRNLFRFLDSLPGLYLVGGLACLLTTKAQRVGDIAANTIVVRRQPVPEPDLDGILRDKFNSFRAYPHLAARLRQRTSPEEAGMLLQALLRRNELNPDDRVALFRRLADHFRGRVAFPQEAMDGLSDEQYARNLLDILFRK